MRIDSPIMTNTKATGSFTGSFIGAVTADTLAGAGYDSFSASLASGIATNASDIAALENFSSSLSNDYLLNSVYQNDSASFAVDIITNDGRLDNLEAKTLISSSNQIDHNSTTNYVSNQHIDHSTITLTAGVGLTGGGDITGNRTFNVGVGSGISASSDEISVDDTVLRTTGDNVISGSDQIIALLPAGTVSGSVQVDHDQTTNFVESKHIDHSTVSVIAGNGLTGGGTIADSRTITVGAGVGVTVNTNDIAIGQDVATTANVTFATASITQNLTVGGDLIVQGTRTELQVTELNVEDINITVASGSSTSAEADGAGLTIAGANQALTWNHANQRFNLSTDVNVEGDITLTGTVDGVDILATSQSFESRITAAESELGNNLISSSAQVDHDQTTNFDANEHFTQAQITTVGTVTSGDVSAILPSGTVSGSTQVDHDQTTNFVENEHIDHSSVTLTAGDGLTGGGDITTNRSFSVGQGDGISISADAVAVDATVLRTTGDNVISGSDQVDHNSTTNYDANQHVDHTSVTLTAGVGLSGGGNIASSRTFDIDFTDATFQSNISGSFTGLSSSFESRITAAEGELGNTLISSSAQVDHDQTTNFDANEHFTQAQITTVGTVTSGDVSAILPSGTVSGSVQVSHDSTTGFVADEHIAHSGVTLTAGVGLSGGGTIAASRTFNIDFSDATFKSRISGSFTDLSSSFESRITSAESELGNTLISSSAQVDHDQTTNYDANEHFTQAQITTVGTVTSGDVKAILPSGTVSGSVQVAHDSTTGFVANEHIDHSTVSITAGSGLTGGGTIASTRTLTIGQGTGITVSADSIATNDSQIVHDNLSGFVANEHIDHSTVTITAGSGLTGGGTIAETRTLNVGQGDGISVTADAVSVDSTVLRTTGDSVISASAQIDHDATTNFVADEHINHTSVTLTAGSGLTGGGTIDASRTFDVGQGDGISVAADAVAVDSTVARKNIDNNFSVDQTFGNITVNGTGSFAFISSTTGSAKLIGDAYIVVNTDTPASRYAGLKVFDSGSANTTASLEFDGQTNDWFYEYSDDGGATSEHGVIIFGAEYSTKGTPTYPSTNKVQKGLGGHHIGDSNITDTGTLISLSTGADVTGSIRATADIVAYHSSDERLKDNVTPIYNAVEKVNLIGGYEFDWNSNQSTHTGHDIGVIAQEVEKILPEIVATRDDGYKAVKYEKLTAVLIQAVKELTARVEELEKK